MIPCWLPIRCAWLEAGRFDDEGHKLGARLAGQIADGVAEIAEIVLRLARQGRRVRVVTDHGWLLMPGGLPFAELHSGMTVPNVRGNRIALLKEGAPTTYVRLPWSWDSSVLLATPPGVRAFHNGTESTPMAGSAHALPRSTHDLRLTDRSAGRPDRRHREAVATGSGVKPMSSGGVVAKGAWRAIHERIAERNALCIFPRQAPLADRAGRKTVNLRQR